MTDSNLQLYGIGSAPAWSLPRYATPAQHRALAKVYTSGPFMVEFLGMTLVSDTTPGPPASDNDVNLQTQWSAAVGPGGDPCYVFSFKLLDESRVVFEPGYFSGQTPMTTLAQLESQAQLPGDWIIQAVNLPLHAADWITRWDSIDITYYPNMAC